MVFLRLPQSRITGIARKCQGISKNQGRFGITGLLAVWKTGKVRERQGIRGDQGKSENFARCVQQK